jgi:hypothetical protein
MSFRLSVDSSETIFRKILFYIAHNQLNVNDKNLTLNSDANFIFKLDGLITKNILDSGYTNIDLSVDTSTFNIFYENKEINVSVKYREEPVVIHGGAQLFGVVLLESDKTTILDFVKASYLYYKKYHTRDNKHSKETSIYTNEGRYWEFQKRINVRSLDNIFLDEELKSNIVSDLEEFFKPETKELYYQCGITWKRIYMLHGLPGTGKTSLVKALANKFDKSISVINSDIDLKDSDLIKLFTELNKDTFLLLEDIDGLFGVDEKNKQNTISYSTLLNLLDGVVSSECVCFITTNNVKHIQKSLIRPGRIDGYYEFSYLKKPEIKKMFDLFTQNTDPEVSTQFYKNVKHLKLTGALLQNYLFKYLKNPSDAVSNVSEFTEIIKLVLESDKNLYT